MDDSKGFNFAWTDETMKIFVDLCLQFRQKYGRNQKYKWPQILKDFEKITGKRPNQSSMKNKYDNMKKDYKSWKALRQSETGLGWNASTRTITADDAWWVRKIKEDKNCKKYRIKPLPSDVEDLWEQLFGNNAHTHHTQPHAPTQHTQLPAPTQQTQATTSTSSKKDQKLLKRKRKQSEGSLKLAQHLERVEPTSSRTLATIDSITSSSINQHRAPEDQIVEGLRLLDKMADEGYLAHASPMWCFAAEKITNDKSRVLFLNMRDDSSRLAWIKWAYAKQG